MKTLVSFIVGGASWFVLNLIIISFQADSLLETGRVSSLGTIIAIAAGIGIGRLTYNKIK